MEAKVSIGRDARPYQWIVTVRIDAAFAKGGGVVRVPAGKHEVKPFVLKSNITLKFEDGAQISASTNINDYSKKLGTSCFIYAENATNVAIIGN